MSKPILDKLAEWKRLADASTPGPWQKNGTGTIVCDLDETCEWTVIAPNGGVRNSRADKEADFSFLVASREGWPKSNEALRVAVEALEYICESNRTRVWYQDDWGKAKDALARIAEILGEGK